MNAPKWAQPEEARRILDQCDDMERQMRREEKTHHAALVIMFIITLILIGVTGCATIPETPTPWWPNAWMPVIDAKGIDRAQADADVYECMVQVWAIRDRAMGINGQDAAYRHGSRQCLTGRGYTVLN